MQRWQTHTSTASWDRLARSNSRSRINYLPRTPNISLIEQRQQCCFKLLKRVRSDDVTFEKRTWELLPQPCRLHDDTTHSSETGFSYKLKLTRKQMVNQIIINAKQTKTESYKYVLKYQLKLVMKLANQSKWFWINALKCISTGQVIWFQKYSFCILYLRTYILFYIFYIKF